MKYLILITALLATNVQAATVADCFVSVTTAGKAGNTLEQQQATLELCFLLHGNKES